MDSATKPGIDAANTASKGVVLKTIEATGDLIGNKVADRITSAGKTKSKEKEDQANKKTRNLLTTRKKAANRWLKIVNIKTEYQKITDLLNTIPGSVLWFITKNGYKFMISLVTQKIDTNQVNQ